MSLGALEAELKPRVLETFDNVCSLTVQIHNFDRPWIALTVPAITNLEISK